MTRYYRVETDGHLTPTAPPASQGVGVPASGEQTCDPLTPEAKQRWVHHVFEQISERYDVMNDLESFGLHRAWKRVLIERAAAVEPRDILDVATGTGDIALALAQRCPAARVVGFDFSEAMLAVAAKRHSSAVHPAPNLAFLRGNAMEMPFDDVSFDVVTISFGLRNMPDYQRVLSEMVRVLRPGGLLLCLEASYPTLPVVKQGFRVYFRHIMPLMGRLVTKRPDEYRWLNDSTEAFLAKPQLAQLMADCGLIDIHYRSYLLGSAALHSGLRAGCQ